MGLGIYLSDSFNPNNDPVSYFLYLLLELINKRWNDKTTGVIRHKYYQMCRTDVREIRQHTTTGVILNNVIYEHIGSRVWNIFVEQLE